MTIDLSAVPTLTDDLGLYDIPLQRDTFPYAQLQAQGRYPDRSTPNTLPEFLATLNASDAGFTPDMLSTDGKRNLNVNLAASAVPSGGGGGVGTAAYDGQNVSGALVTFTSGAPVLARIWDNSAGDLAGITLSIALYSASGTGSVGEVLVYLEDDNIDNQVFVGFYEVSHGTTILAASGIHMYIPFLPNLDLQATFPTASTHINLRVAAANCAGEMRYAAQVHH